MCGVMGMALKIFLPVQCPLFGYRDFGSWITYLREWEQEEFFCVTFVLAILSQPLLDLYGLGCCCFPLDICIAGIGFSPNIGMRILLLYSPSLLFITPMSFSPALSTPPLTY